LCDPEPIAFRYGDYRSLRRPYLVADYRADAAGWRVERGVYVEAEWDPRDPLGEMNFIAEVRKPDGFPTVAIAQAWLDHSDCPQVLEGQARHAFVRRAMPAWRRSGCTSSCRRRGASSRRQRASRPISRTPPSC
jgi:predicted TIM-barrel fold metal-dependent hydrolase